MATPSSVVLVTGINGFIGSHVADQFLTAGYKVRGTVRSIVKAEAVQKILTDKHGEGMLEIVAVPDITVDGAFDEAVKGVHAVAHVASILSFSSDPREVIPPTVAAVASILASSAKEPTIECFVYTSSSTAATAPKPNVQFKVDPSTWNEEDVKAAWEPDQVEDKNYGGSMEWIVYGASKVEAEKALWKFRDEKKPAFRINSVLPDTNFGPVMSPEVATSTGGFIKMIYDGNINDPFLKSVLPQHYVDVRDTARLHVASVLFPDVQDQRLFGWAAPFDWNLVLQTFRELRPEHQFPEDIESMGHDMSTVTNGDAEKLLVRMGRPGFIGWRECIDGSLKSIGV